jgi:hypothetical protein
LAGPPCVVTNTSVKYAWNEAMMPMIRLKKMIGLRSGSVTWRNRANAPAPSIEAASWRLAGTPWRPARKMISGVPMPPQRVISTIDGFESAGSNSQRSGVSPRPVSSAFASPNSGLKTQSQSSALATTGICEGR